MIGFTNEERMAVILANGYTVKEELATFKVERYDRYGFHDEELSVHVLRVYKPNGAVVEAQAHPDTINRLFYVDHIFWKIYKETLMGLMTKRSKKTLAL